MNLEGLHRLNGRVKNVLRNLAHAKAWNNLHQGKRAKVGCFGVRRDAVECVP